MEKETIGFIGLGFIGTAYANNYESRGYSVVRYEKGISYRASKAKLAQCDIVFLAVPTPTTPRGFNDSVIREVLKVVAPGTIVVIKSTVLPGRTKDIQAENPDICILFSPEFLSVVTAQADADQPPRNVIGMPVDDAVHRRAAEQVMKTFPEASYNLICDSTVAELIKYGKNTLGYLRVLHTNFMYDYAESLGADFEDIKAAMAADPQLPGDRYLTPVHQSGRGAGGECYIKDFEAFIEGYGGMTEDESGLQFLRAARDKNLALLGKTNKDAKIVRGVYGKDFN